jgi:transcriptional regulator with XRE-family HTH domain
MTSVKQIVGKNIEALMKRPPRMTRAELARALKIDQGVIGRWIKGVFLPDSKNLDAMAIIFKVPVGRLFSAPEIPPEIRSTVDIELDALEIVAAKFGAKIRRPKNNPPA